MVISCACTISRSNSRARCPTSPPNTGNRYFVIHTILLAVPDRVTSGLRILHTRSVASQSPKGEGFTDPKGGTLNVLARDRVENCVSGAAAAYNFTLNAIQRSGPRRIAS